ncbi:MAG: hypothetical protein HY324_02160, partial [Chlamydiia bacterium]|nr:hypothetical protein [Chlamydiia bacterium]
MSKIEIFSRQAFFSSISAHKKRPLNFSRESCFRNLVNTTDFSQANLRIVFDLAKGTKETHFLNGEKRFPIFEFRGGSEATSFLFLLQTVSRMKLDPKTILYFVEDDYLHKEGWVEILLEGFSLPGVD